MILKENMAFFGLTKILPVFVFTSCYQLQVFFRSSFVFKYFYTVKIMLYLIIGINHYPPLVPFADGLHKPGLFFSGNQVVKGSQSPVAVYAHLGVRMLLIIENLIF